MDLLASDCTYISVMKRNFMRLTNSASVGRIAHDFVRHLDVILVQCHHRFILDANM